MDGHAVTLSETNAYNWVATCECGWIGPICVTPTYRSPNKKRLQYQVDVGKATALGTHAAHVRAFDPGPPLMTDAMVESQRKYIEAVAPTVRRVGRFGSG